MARDIKVNYNQFTVGKMRRMCDTLLSLGDDQRAVTIPERALQEASPVGGNEEGEGDGEGSRSEEDLMEVGDEEGLCGVVGEGGDSPKTKRKKGTKDKKKKKIT